jgi:hypothetical protein
LLFHFSSTVTIQTLVGFLVKGHTNITQDASIGFSIFTICPGVVHDFFMCLVTILTQSSNILLLSLFTFNTLVCLPLSAFLPDITCTKSQTLIFINTRKLIIKPQELNSLFFGNLLI